MFRVRFHGRGGQGIKTASRILGTALFFEGFQVQDAPRYGAERRGAPIFAYVRADRKTIFERGVIPHPDLVVVVDDTLVGVSAAAVLEGLDTSAVVLIHSEADTETWRERLNSPARILALPAPPADSAGERPQGGAECVGAAARLLGGIPWRTLARALEAELEGLPRATVEANRTRALAGFDAMAEYEGIVEQHDATFGPRPAWIDLPTDPSEIAAPTIHAGATSVKVRTGLWRILRPVLVPEDCNKCIWVCGNFCPDGVIGVDASGYPAIDYDHCKGCLVCVVQCPKHALVTAPERDVALGGAA